MFSRAAGGGDKLTRTGNDSIEFVDGIAMSFIMGSFAVIIGDERELESIVAAIDEFLLLTFVPDRL